MTDRESMEKHRKKIIGITGGVGAGKSSVLEILKQEFHARVILADLVAHTLMEPGEEGLLKVTRVLGSGFLDANGQVDRKALADLIFHDEAARTAVNQIIHPMVWERIQREALTCPEQLIVIEAAVFDTAPDGLFDEIWYVYTAEETRIARLMESRGYTREKCESIIKRQDSESEYRKRCNRVIDNNGGTEQTAKQLKEILINETC